MDTRLLEVGASGERDRRELGECMQPDTGEPLAIERTPARTYDRRVERGEEVVLRLRGERGLRRWRAHRALENVDESSPQLTERGCLTRGAGRDRRRREDACTTSARPVVHPEEGV